MSPIPDDFEQLRTLLALKRYEQPPPGYFQGFSRQVIVRIKTGDLGNESEASFWSFGTGSVFQRLWATLDARPVLAGAFGVAVCGFFVVGALLSDSTSATADEKTSVPTPIAHGRVWEQQAASGTQISSMTGGAVPDYQPPSSSLFDEIRAKPELIQQDWKLQQVDLRIRLNSQ